MSQRELLGLASAGELVEASAYASMIESAPDALKRSSLASVRRIGSACLFAIPSVAWPTPNRILGLGISEPATEAMVDEVVASCGELAIPQFCVPVCSCALPDQDRIVKWLTQRGFRLYNKWVKLHRGDEEPPSSHGDPKLVLKKIGKDHARHFARIVIESFGYPQNYAEWLQAPVGKDGWHHFMAFLGDAPVATGVLFVKDGVGNLLIGSTLQSHRRLGAQTMLFHERLTYGIDLGCRMFFTETHVETPETPNPSYHNMLRAGFSPVYSRINYLLEGTKRL